MQMCRPRAIQNRSSLDEKTPIKNVKIEGGKKSVVVLAGAFPDPADFRRTAVCLLLLSPNTVLGRTQGLKTVKSRGQLKSAKFGEVSILGKRFVGFGC